MSWLILFVTEVCFLNNTEADKEIAERSVVRA